MSKQTDMEILEAAKPGPWKLGTGYEQETPGLYVSDRNGDIVFADMEGSLTEADAAFIVYNDPEKVGKMLDRIDELELENAALRLRIDALETAVGSVGRLTEFVKEASSWRERCREYDDDMGHAPRDFSDDEDWEILEKAARQVLGQIEEDDQ